MRKSFSGAHPLSVFNLLKLNEIVSELCYCYLFMWTVKICGAVPIWSCRISQVLKAEVSIRVSKWLAACHSGWQKWLRHLGNGTLWYLTHYSISHASSDNSLIQPALQIFNSVLSWCGLHVYSLSCRNRKINIVWGGDGMK